MFPYTQMSFTLHSQVSGLQRCLILPPEKALGFIPACEVYTRFLSLKTSKYKAFRKLEALSIQGTQGFFFFSLWVFIPYCTSHSLNQTWKQSQNTKQKHSRGISLIHDKHLSGIQSVVLASFNDVRVNNLKTNGFLIKTRANKQWKIFRCFSLLWSCGEKILRIYSTSTTKLNLSLLQRQSVVSRVIWYIRIRMWRKSKRLRNGGIIHNSSRVLTPMLHRKKDALKPRNLLRYLWLNEDNQEVSGLCTGEWMKANKHKKSVRRKLDVLLDFLLDLLLDVLSDLLLDLLFFLLLYLLLDLHLGLLLEFLQALQAKTAPDSRWQTFSASHLFSMTLQPFIWTEKLLKKKKSHYTSDFQFHPGNVGMFSQNNVNPWLENCQEKVMLLNKYLSPSFLSIIFWEMWQNVIKPDWMFYPLNLMFKWQSS